MKLCIIKEHSHFQIHWMYICSRTRCIVFSIFWHPILQANGNCLELMFDMVPICCSVSVKLVNQVYKKWIFVRIRTNSIKVAYIKLMSREWCEKLNQVKIVCYPIQNLKLVFDNVIMLHLSITMNESDRTNCIWGDEKRKKKIVYYWSYSVVCSE